MAFNRRLSVSSNVNKVFVKSIGYFLWFSGHYQKYWIELC